MGRAHLVPPALAFLAGIESERHGLAAAALALALVGAVGIALASNAHNVPTRSLATVAALALGVLEGRLIAHPSQALGDPHTTRMSALLVAVGTRTEDRFEATLCFADGTLGTTSLPQPADPIGTRLLLRGKREPFDEPRNPGEPSSRELESERGIAWHLARAHVLAREPVDVRDVTLWLPRLRAWASQRLHDDLGEPDATILAGALWGERGALAPELRAEFQDTGTVHVLVTAGLHLGVVAVLALTLLGACGIGRVPGSLAAIGIVWAYAIFSGAHLPSVRAATMLSFALLARAAGRQPYSWNALALAAAVLGALRPASVESVSFALSFSCVAAIFAFARPFAEASARFGAPELVAELAGVACAAQLGTWPLTAAAFLVIAPYAPLANALVVPVVGVAMLFGLAELAATPLPPLAHVFVNIERTLLDWIVGAVRMVGTLPGAHVTATPPPWWSLALYDGALLAAALAHARRRFAVAAAAIVAASALCLWPPRTVNHDLIITAIDVGQADALLIRTPRGHAFLVDAGGRLERGPQLAGTSSAEDVGARIVVPFLVRGGIHHLDAVLLSHPHGDHAGGIAPVLRALGGDAFADSGQTYSGHAYHDALDVAGAQHVPILEPRGGDVWQTNDGITFRFYGPTYPYIAGSRNDINSNSLVFRLEYKGFRMLFTGDAGAETETRLLRAGDDLRADVLKVGHHGSAYGTTAAFVQAVVPRAAIISVGRNNLFGHPAPATIATLINNGARVYRTDEDGAITVDTNGSSIEVTPFLARDSTSSNLLRSAFGRSARRQLSDEVRQLPSEQRADFLPRHVERF